MKVIGSYKCISNLIYYDYTMYNKKASLTPDFRDKEESNNNMDEEYKMGDAVLGRATQEKDLGVTFSADMKVSEQCGIVASKGNQFLGLIRRTIMYKEKQLIVPLYKAIVRPHLEYCIQAWRPYRKKDIDKLERIQRRATKNDSRIERP